MCIKYDYDDDLSFEENRGSCISRVNKQIIGDYAERLISELTNCTHLGTGARVDFENNHYAFELKKNPRTDNSSSKKQNIRKGKAYAKENGKEFAYAYWQNRPNNKYIQDDVLHLHGRGLFDHLGVSDKYDEFLQQMDNASTFVINTLRDKFNECSFS